jgi:hypothetical protein
MTEERRASTEDTKSAEAAAKCSSCIHRGVAPRDEPCRECLTEFPKHHSIFVEEGERKDSKDIIHDGGCRSCRYDYGDDDDKTPFFICESCKRKIAWCYGGDGDELCNYCWELSGGDDGSE